MILSILRNPVSYNAFICRELLSDLNDQNITLILTHDAESLAHIRAAKYLAGEEFCKHRDRLVRTAFSKISKYLDNGSFLLL